MPSPTLPADPAGRAGVTALRPARDPQEQRQPRKHRAPAVRVVLITLDRHVAGAVDRARETLARDLPNLRLDLHFAAEWATQPDALAACKRDIAEADVIIATMLFMEDHVQAVLPDIEARRDHCDAVMACIAAGEIVKQTRLGRFSMSAKQSGPMALLKRLRGKSRSGSKSAGAGQMAVLRQIPRILRFIPGTAQDVRAYFIGMQYWLAGSEGNLASLIRFLVNRYASGPREALRGTLNVADPIAYPDVGLYHPDAAKPITDKLADLPMVHNRPGARGTVGLLVMRSYLLADDCAHYDGVIRALEARGLNVIPAFASGLDARPAIDAYFMEDGRATVDAVLSLTGFSLVGGPAYNDAKAAEDILRQLDVPYLGAHALEFQSIEEWRRADRGLMPIESTIMIAIPEIDGATAPTVFGGRIKGGTTCAGCARACKADSAKGAHQMVACAERVENLADRTAKMVALRRAERRDRKLAVVLFNFPPNAGATGTAAFLSVFESLHNTLTRLKEEGYTVNVPKTVDDLRNAVLQGNAAQFGTDANVHASIPVDDHIARERYLTQIEEQWGPAPGTQQADGTAIHVLGRAFGNVLVAVQPGFGYEGDPMRLLFEGSFAPTHAFSAFYRYLREDFGAHAYLHFGTHGALEFMPGKQSGLTDVCWPDRLIGDVPNIYLYAANNPSEGTIAKRRSAATLVSYLTPAVARAGLYRGLADLKASLDRWRSTELDAVDERRDLEDLIIEQARAVDLLDDPDPSRTAEDAAANDNRARAHLTGVPLVQMLTKAVLELEYTLIPHGLHVVGAGYEHEHRIELLTSIAEAKHDVTLPSDVVAAIIDGKRPREAERLLGARTSDDARAALDT
ncbi:MAG: magnesium chelatase subunit H, partial [Pseudomonadota bacterium]